MGSFFSKLCFCSDCCISRQKKQKAKESIDKSIGNRDNGRNGLTDHKLNDKVTDDMRLRRIRDIVIDEKTDTISVILSNQYTDEEQTEQILIDDDTMDKEIKQFVKRDDISYDKQMVGNNLLSVKNFSQKGLIQDNSNEFLAIKQFLMSKNYQLKEAIGSGNYSQVYRGLSEPNGKQVAIKSIDLSTASLKFGLDFIPRETAIIRKLRHNNIISVYQMIRTKSKILVVMELSTKGTIAQMLSKYGSFTEFMSWLMFRSILEGLDHIHSLKIAHRNLKLENILLSQCFNPKISDFCYAKIIDNQRLKSRDFSPSLAYSAPEVLRQLPYNPFISDIWSLGVCLYIMLNDRLPFVSDNKIEVIEKQMRHDFSHTKITESEISMQLKIFIGLMFEPEVDLRPDTKTLLRHDWIATEPTSQFIKSY